MVIFLALKLRKVPDLCQGRRIQIEGRHTALVCWCCVEKNGPPTGKHTRIPVSTVWLFDEYEGPRVRRSVGNDVASL